MKEVFAGGEIGTLPLAMSVLTNETRRFQVLRRCVDSILDAPTTRQADCIQRKWNGKSSSRCRTTNKHRTAEEDIAIKASLKVRACEV